jgi:drug/metabolite transporter (DMT)-like permease
MVSPSSFAEAGTQAAPHPYRWLVLALGPVAFSTASILTRLAAAPSLVVGAWRMALAALLLTPWAWPRLRREWHTLTRRDVLTLCLAGTALALHFATWITSLSYTTVASSVILVTMNPLFVGLAERFLFKARVSRLQGIAIVIALTGSIIVSYGDVRFSPQALLGDALALLGALCMSAYMLLGRAVRRKLSTLAYIWPCYGLAGILLVALSFITRQPLLGYSGNTYGAFLALALVPQILGHSSCNWALAHFSPILITLAILGEPIGASLLALLILGEIPPLTAPLGGLLIIAGIYLASRQELAAAS